MSEFNPTFSLLKRLEHQQKIRPELIEFGYFILGKDRNLNPNTFIACLACMSGFVDGRTAINDDYLKEFLSDLALNEFQALTIDEQLCEASIVGTSGDLNLFIYEKGLLYLHSFYEYENELADWILNKAETLHQLDEEQQEIVDQYYPKLASDEGDLQASAVKLSLIKSLMFLTGGPGTGKTYTVQKIIEIHKAIYGQDFKIELAAPTGKAAQRINDSISTLNDDSLKAQTIHRLLGARRGFQEFKYSKDNPLNVDLLIIDEASMMDLSLWIAVINAIPEHAKLIIVGDSNQLASVEAGAVLSDICKPADNSFSVEIASKIGNEATSKSTSALNDCIIRLEKSKRFGAQTGIQKLAEAIRAEDVDLAHSLLSDSSITDVTIVDNNAMSLETVKNEFAISPYFEKNAQEELTQKAILCAVKNGETGSRTLNRQIEDTLKSKLGSSRSKEWYANRKITINRNQHALDIRNGEIGFYSNENESVNFDERSVPVSRLQFYDPGYCITIHKSQGSEYKHVAIVLPSIKNRVLSKELLYTGVTRASESVLIVGDMLMIKETILSPTVRSSGLKRKLWD
ncbi:MAG: exodeoxyribonuclease V subunit alpha [Balneolaceae bacterium]|nr:exodeoxyribonuclease V subunit alpha [Balneolaceae bacterium]